MPAQIGRVVAVYPAQRTIDVALKNGATLTNVPVTTNVAGTHEGSMYLPAVAVGSGRAALSYDSDTLAVIVYVDGDYRKPYCVGLLFPELAETSFSSIDVNKRLGGSYVAFDSDGFEISRPDGTFVRIGTTTTRVVDSATSADSAKVPFSRTTGTAIGAPHIVINHSSGLIIDITPAGAINITKAGGGTFELTSHVHGGVTAGAGTTTGPQ